MNRHLKIFFTLSLLLNITLIGVVAGAAYKRWDDDGPRFSESRDPQFNHKMAKSMMEARKGQEPLFKEMRAAKGEINKVLAADMFDEAAFHAASEKMYAAQAAMFKARNEAMLNMAKDMSAEERKELAAHMKAMSERHEKHGGKREGARKDNAHQLPPPPEE